MSALISEAASGGSGVQAFQVEGAFKDAEERIREASKPIQEQIIEQVGKQAAEHQERQESLQRELGERINKLKQELASEKEEKAALQVRVEDLQSRLEASEADAAAKAREIAVLKLFSFVCGKVAWEKYFGDIGEEPPIPETILQDLNNPCPIWPEKRIKDTHLLILVPKTVNGQPLTLNLLKELIENPKEGGPSTKYDYYFDDVKDELGDKPVPASHWVLMTTDVIPDSRNKTYDDQKALVAALKKRTGAPYELPKALEALTAILMHHVRTGERLYPENLWTYTRCQEKVDENRWPVAIGRFASGGIIVCSDRHGVSDDDGVAALRKC